MDLGKSSVGARGPGKGKEREEAYFEMTVFLSRRGREKTVYSESKALLHDTSCKH